MTRHRSDRLCGRSAATTKRPTHFPRRGSLPARDPPIAVRAATVRDRTPGARSTTVALHLEELQDEVVRLAVPEHFPLDNGGVAAGVVAANNGAEEQPRHSQLSYFYRAEQLAPLLRKVVASFGLPSTVSMPHQSR